MVRTASTRTRYQIYSAYKHRESTYIRRPGYIDISQAELLINQPVVKSTDEAFVLPPKQPIPDVILRTDLMSERRSKLAL